MGRKKEFEFEKYFVFNTDTNISTCLQCEKQLKGQVTGNIKRHLKKMHGLCVEGDTINEEPSGSGSVLALSSNVIRREKKFSITIDMNKSDFLKCCVGLVTNKNIPFRIFDDKLNFKKLIKPYERLFETNLNSRNIVEKIDETSDKMKQIISKSVNKKLVCLKLDIATRLDKNILGINIQYIDNFKIRVITLGMIQLKKRHTAEFLKNEVINCLKEFNIQINQIYSSTTDNGANVLKASRLLKEMQEEWQNTQPVNGGAACDSENSNSEDQFEEIHRQLKSVLSVVRCAAHTIQLAANDVLKNIQTQLEECRKAVKALRVVVRAGECNIQMPILDNNTRWNSSFHMIESLFNIRSVIENNEELATTVVDVVDWHFVQNF